MNFKLLISLLAMLVLSTGVWAQQDPLDQGAADTLMFAIEQPVAGVASQVVAVELYVFHDVQYITGTSAAFSWDNPKLAMESVVWTQQAIDSFDLTRLIYYRGRLDSTNAARMFQFVTSRMFTAGLPPSPSRQLVVTLNFRATDWTATDTCRINLEDFNAFAFVDENVDEYPPIWPGSAVIAGVTSVGGGNLPVRYDLAQNYPNPFNPATKITFDLPERSKTTLAVFNVLGQKVATLVDAELAADRYEVEWDGSNVASGIYFYRLNAEQFMMTKKMMLLK